MDWMGLDYVRFKFNQLHNNVGRKNVLAEGTLGLQNHPGKTFS